MNSEPGTYLSSARHTPAALSGPRAPGRGAPYRRNAVTLATLLILAGASATTDLPRSVEGLQFASSPSPIDAPILSAQAAARMINWPAGNATAGTGWRIGMIDGGVNQDHPALAGQDITVRDFRLDTSQPVPMDHGTAIAALLVGRETSQDFAGLLPGASLYAANIFSRDAEGRSLGHPAAFSAAVDWMIENRVSVINISLSGRHDPLVAAAVKRAIDNGVLVVAAAGNNRGIAGRNFPAAYDGVLSATAVDAGLGIYRYASLGAHIDFAAPGVALHMAANGGSQIASGTSYATPFLTAAVAVAVRGDRAVGTDRVRRILLDHARDLGRRGPDQVFGNGIIDTGDTNILLADQSARRDRATPAKPRLIH